MPKDVVVPFLDIKAEIGSIRTEIDSVVSDVLCECDFVLGRYLHRLEKQIAEYCNVSHAIGVASGTDALNIALKSLEIDSNDAVITTPFSFIATSECINIAGATPLFCDIEDVTYNLSPLKIKEYIKRNTSFDKEKKLLKDNRTGKYIKGIIPVHIFGHPAKMDEILDIAREWNLFVIEDAAQAFGARCKQGIEDKTGGRGQGIGNRERASFFSGSNWQAAVCNTREPSAISHQPSAFNSTGNKKQAIDSSYWKVVGSMGDVGCLSFYPSKNLGACGDAGMIITNNSKIAERCKKLRTHGTTVKYYHSEIGFNSRLDTLQAAILCVKLNYLDKWLEMRRNNARIYYEIFAKNFGNSKVKLLMSKTVGAIHELPLHNNESDFIILPSEDLLAYHTYNSFNIRAPRREKLIEHLNSKNIGAMIYYPLPLHLQEAYKYLGYKTGDLPVSERVSREILALPMYPLLNEKQIAYVVECIKEFFLKT